VNNSLYSFVDVSILSLKIFYSEALIFILSCIDKEDISSCFK
jgi:hypothetical protein